MTDITIQIDREIHRRLRGRAQQAGTTVPLLIADLVQANALLLSDPEWSITPRAILRKVSQLLEHHASPEEIAQQLGLSEDVVTAATRELERLERLAQRYAQ
jgi:hypothetical protein